MSFRIRVSLGLALLLSLALAVPVWAGGWAVITLDELPTHVVAGGPLSIGFTVRQHGITPMDGLEPIVVANLYKEQELKVIAEQDGEPGHYTATLTFPKEGEWRWIIRAFSMEQLMPTLSVAPAAGGTVARPSPKTVPARADLASLWIVRSMALAAGLAALALAYRRKSRLALALTVAAVAIGLASFVTGPAVPAAEAQARSDESAKAPAESAFSQVELGRRLFIAKGCITCHYNSRAAARSEYWTIEMGAPDLSNYSSSREILFLRLKDPAAARSDTKMPNLGLKETEIEALIAFINSK